MELRRQFKVGDTTFRVNWLIAACVVITVTAFVRLGFWQLDRAAEKLQAQEELEAQQRGNPVAVETLPPSMLDPANPQLRNLHVALDGEYLNDRTILVLAQFFDDQIGYEVVTPFRLSSDGTLVLVSRGWTTGILPPDTPPRLRPVDGPVQAMAQIHVPEEGTRNFPSRIDASQWPLRVRSIEIDVLSSILGEPVFPYVLRLTEGQPGVLARHWPASNADINTNLSYALQWFTFAVVVLLIALVASSDLMTRRPDRT